MGPWFGWMGGWAITMTGVLVVGSLAEVGVRFTLLMFGLDDLASNTAVVLVLAILLVAVMTWICVSGTEISGRLQTVLIIAQVLALLALVVVALYLSYSGRACPARRRRRGRG